MAVVYLWSSLLPGEAACAWAATQPPRRPQLSLAQTRPAHHLPRAMGSTRRDTALHCTMEKIRRETVSDVERVSRHLCRAP